MSKSHHFHINLPERLNAWLEEQKLERGINKTAIVIQLIEQAKETADGEG